jgi:hypothetical protein
MFLCLDDGKPSLGLSPPLGSLLLPRHLPLQPLAFLLRLLQLAPFLLAVAVGGRRRMDVDRDAAVMGVYGGLQPLAPLRPQPFQLLLGRGELGDSRPVLDVVGLVAERDVPAAGLAHDADRVRDLEGAMLLE